MIAPFRLRYQKREMTGRELLTFSFFSFLVSYFIICFDRPELHQKLEAEEVISANGLQFKQFAEDHQLWPLQVFQGQLILK